MEKVALNHAFNPSVFRLFDPSLSSPKRPDYVNLCRNQKKKFVVLASKGEPPSFNSEELMELKFGRMLGEDPKLTMAKIMGKRMNPDMSNLEIEKLFYNKKSKGINTEIEDMPFDAYDNRRSSESSNGLNLVRPVLKKGLKFEMDNKPKVAKLKKLGKPAIIAPEDTRSKVPNVILHKKPSIYSEEGGGDEEIERLRIKPIFSLKMSKEQTKERFTDLTLIRKPKPVNLNLENEEENQETTTSKQEFTSNIKEYDAASLLEKPKMNLENEEENQETTTSKEFTSNIKEYDVASLMEKPKMNLENEKENQETTTSKQEFTSNIKEYDVASLLEKPKMNLENEKENQETTTSKQEFTSNIKELDVASLLKKPMINLENEVENQERAPSRKEFTSNIEVVASLLEKPKTSLENEEENQETMPFKNEFISNVEECDESSLLEKPKKFKNDEENQEATLSKKEFTSNTEKYDLSSLLQKPKVNLRKDEENQEATPSRKEFTSNIEEHDLSSLFKKPTMNLENDKENQEATPSRKEFTSNNEDSELSLLLENLKLKLDLDDDRREEGLRDYSDNVEEKDLDVFLEDQGQEMNFVSDFKTQVTVDAALQGKPERLDRHIKETQKTFKGGTIAENDGSDDFSFELENSAGTYDIKEREDADWARAEDLVLTGRTGEAEIISSSTKGFVVSFGSLVGFVPYRFLSPKWTYCAFETWLRRNDIDPASYKENLGVIGPTLDSTLLDEQLGDKLINSKITPGMKIEDLIKIYELEKRSFMLSFVGQKTAVYVISVDRTSRRLIFSIKPREMDDTIKRKRNLMARLEVGDIVKCCIVKITFFGVFVKIEGVDALIHQTEVSWDSTLDPSSYFRIGQIVDAKVHQLDFSLERIYLSLKESTPDPLIGTFESVLSNNGSLVEVAEPETEWADMETLVKELDQVEGIKSVSKGRYCLSPSSAPTFQVYMASMFDNQYKLLARSENRVQEVIVETSLSKEEMKSCIQTCTNRVA